MCTVVRAHLWSSLINQIKNHCKHKGHARSLPYTICIRPFLHKRTLQIHITYLSKLTPTTTNNVPITRTCTTTEGQEQQQQYPKQQQQLKKVQTTKSTTTARKSKTTKTTRKKFILAESILSSSYKARLRTDSLTKCG